MRDNFPACLDHTLGHEGGWADHPKDPGGATMKGVTLETYRKWKPGATKRELRAITDAELQQIYRAGYWNPVGGDGLPRGVDLATFDASVNSGAARGRKWLAVAQSKASDAVGQVKALCAVRLGFVQGLGTWSVFGRGWARRIAGVEAAGIRMAAGAGAVRELDKAAAEARARKAAEAKKAGGAGAGASGAAGGGVATAPTDDLGLALFFAAIVAILVVIAVVAFVNRRNQGEREKALTAEARRYIPGGTHERV